MAICRNGKEGFRGIGEEKVVAILLSTYNGERYLEEQLASFEDQSYPCWQLLWRDDGSTDSTRYLMEEFTGRVGDVRCREVNSNAGRLGVQKSFLSLLSAAQEYALVAFADQDDVWLPDKLARGVKCLERVRGNSAALYCGRQILVDNALRVLRWSRSFSTELPFPSSIAQNIATGCTVMLNQEAIRVIERSVPPEVSLHDWWSYIVVTAVQGQVVFDDDAHILYRQHSGNVIGGPSASLRIWRALRKGPGFALEVIDAHALAVQESVLGLPAEARAKLLSVRKALRGSFWERLRFVLGKELRRQHWSETMLLSFWILAHRIRSAG